MHALEHKVPPPVVCVLVAAAMWLTAWMTPVWEFAAPARAAVAGVFAVAALAYGLPAFRAFGRARTTINPVNIEAASALVTTGVYGTTRNPMYVALTALLLAWLAWLAAPWAALGPAAFVLFITRFQIMPEERVMRAKFGVQYEAYRLRARRWV